MKFKIGDRVVLHKPNDVSESPHWTPEMEWFDGVEIIIKCISDGGRIIHEGYAFNVHWAILSNSKQSTIMNIIQKAKLAITPEPEKSFIKAGIMNTDGTLTSDGQTVLLGYLLEQNKAAFKTDVVDALLADDK